MLGPRGHAWRLWAGTRISLAVLMAWAIGLGLPDDAAGLSVQPTVAELRARPGAALNGDFQVVNDTESPLHLRVEVEPLGPSVYARIPPAQWLSLSSHVVTLEPGQTLPVTYTIRVPQSAVGELAAEVVFVQDMPGGGLQVRFGTAVYVSIEDTEELSVEIGELHLDAGVHPVLRVPIMNRGNVHCRPEGHVGVVDDDGTVLARGTIARGMPTFPGRVEHFDAPLTGGPFAAPGGYRLEVQLTCHTIAALPTQVSAMQPGTLDDAGHWQPTTTP